MYRALYTRRPIVEIRTSRTYDAPLFEQRTEDGTSGYSDSEETSSQCMSTDDDSDDDFVYHNTDWHSGMNTVIPGRTADNVNRTVRNGDNNGAQYSAPENENETKSHVNSGPVDRAKPTLTTTGAGIKFNSLGVDYTNCNDIPITKMIPV